MANERQESLISCVRSLDSAKKKMEVNSTVNKLKCSKKEVYICINATCRLNLACSAVFRALGLETGSGSTPIVLYVGRMNTKPDVISSEPLIPKGHGTIKQGEAKSCEGQR